MGYGSRREEEGQIGERKVEVYPVRSDTWPEEDLLLQAPYCVGLTVDLIVIFAFGLFSLAAARDRLTGRIPFLLLGVPILLVGACYPGTFMMAFVPLFSLLFGMYLAIEYLQSAGKLRPGILSFGLGDVLGIPLILTICFVSHPFFGPVIFVAVLAALLPAITRNKSQTKRFLPWLIPPSAAALLYTTFFI